MSSHLLVFPSAPNITNPTCEPHIEEYHGWDEHVCSWRDRWTDGMNDTTLHVVYTSALKHLRCEKPPKRASVENQGEDQRKRKPWEQNVVLLLICSTSYCWPIIASDCIKGGPFMYYIAHPGVKPIPRHTHNWKEIEGINRKQSCFSICLVDFCLCRFLYEETDVTVKSQWVTRWHESRAKRFYPLLSSARFQAKTHGNRQCKKMLFF